MAPTTTNRVRILAARLRVTLDQRLGRTTPAHVIAPSQAEVVMDGQVCDKHPSAQAKARGLFPNLCVLYMCGHCANHFEDQYVGPFHITYETVTV